MNVIICIHYQTLLAYCDDNTEEKTMDRRRGKRQEKENANKGLVGKPKKR